MTDVWHQMNPWLVYACTVILPWLIGAALVYYQSKKDDNHGIRTWCFLAVALIAPFSVPAYFELDSAWKIEEFVNAISCTAQAASSQAHDAIIYAVAAALPMVVLPVSMYWAKVASTAASEKNIHITATTDPQFTDEHKTRSADYQQASLITFIIRTFVIVYIGFGVLNRVGVATGGLLELTAVFSVGISWSMRDWLASTWAGLVLACTTNVTVGCVLRLSVPLLGPVGNVRVIRLGTLFVECESETCDQCTPAFRYYLPNNMLTQNGFAVKKE
jgi:hypothetical protein